MLSYDVIHMYTLKVCGWCWNEEISLWKYHCTCDCFFSIHLSNNSLAEHPCIALYAKRNVHCTLWYNASEQYAIFPFLIRICTTQSTHLYIFMHVHYIHIALRTQNKKKEFHSEIFGSVDTLFSRLAFFCCYYLFIQFSLGFFWTCHVCVYMHA